MGQDDLSFEQLMALEGVKQLKPSKGKARAKHVAPRGPQTSAPAPRVLPPNPLAARVAELEAELAESASANAARDATIASLQADLAAAEAAREDAEQLRDAALEAEQAAIDRITTTQADLDQERTALTETLQARESVAQVLLDRGCASDFEMLEVLNGLLLQRPREFLEALVLADPHGLARVLVDRVAFVARGVDFEADANTVVVRVKKERCEITGIEPSFHGLVQACIDREVSKLTIVGGSPAYRKQLKALAAESEDAPSLNLVSGTRRREARRAEADLRSSDVVVIWGGTELDHSVSAVYRGGSARIVRVAHRGIAGMLQQVRSALRSKG